MSAFNYVLITVILFYLNNKLPNFYRVILLDLQVGCLYNSDSFVRMKGVFFKTCMGKKHLPWAIPDKVAYVAISLIRSSDIWDREFEML